MKCPVVASRTARAAIVPVVLAVSLAACGTGDRWHADNSGPADASAVRPAAAIAQSARKADASLLAAAISSLHQPRPGLYTAGQPEAAAWQVAADQGITTVINLRPAAEMDGRDEAAEVAAAGLDYFEIPVARAGDVNRFNASALRRLIDQARGPVLVHCASGNRVGALLALAEMENGTVSAEQALVFGRTAGLGSLEPRVREVIDNTPAPACLADASC